MKVKKILLSISLKNTSKGIAFRTITLTLNELGMPSPTGRKWCHASVRRIITNEKYVGDLSEISYFNSRIL